MALNFDLPVVSCLILELLVTPTFLVFLVSRGSTLLPRPVKRLLDKLSWEHPCDCLLSLTSIDEELWDLWNSVRSLPTIRAGLGIPSRKFASPTLSLSRLRLLDDFCSGVGLLLGSSVVVVDALWVDCECSFVEAVLMSFVLLVDTLLVWMLDSLYRRFFPRSKFDSSVGIVNVFTSSYQMHCIFLISGLFVQYDYIIIHPIH